MSANNEQLEQVEAEIQRLRAALEAVADDEKTELTFPVWSKVKAALGRD